MKTARWIFGVLSIALFVAGCMSLRKKPGIKTGEKYQAAWTCAIDVIDAKTGKPTEMRCSDAEGTKYRVRAE